MLQAVASHKSINYVAVPIGICLCLWAIANTLPYLPEPIGSRAGMFVTGIKLTIALSVCAGALGLVIGVIAGLGRLSKNAFAKRTAALYVWLITGTPLITQILFMYYILPLCIPSLKLGEFGSALIALALNVGAYNADVVRSGIMSVPKEQEHSGLSLGLSKWQVMRLIIFPQAMRFSALPLMNNFIVLLKDSSLASAIGLLDLTLVGTRVISETFEPMPVLLAVSAIYLVLTTMCNFAVARFTTTLFSKNVGYK